MSEAADVRVTREAYDDIAERYTAMFQRHLHDNPFERAMLDVFAASVEENSGGPVIDIGCGPGRVTGYLQAAAVDVSGIDLSPEMIRIARELHPDLRFEVGTMEHLDVPDAALAGIVAWYSIIHMPPPRVPAVAAEFARALRPGGQLLLAFQASDEPTGIQDYPHKVAPGYRWAPDTLAAELERHGFRVTARLVRDPRPDEWTPHACLLCVRQ
ncbi:class I SAM-dependent DNA methyltransferase [Nocardia sp. NPDC020380]|uniref:class I SAM-dependent DNA methyltransferase n=1 Tax=Nocardia sp. NPDC020380 TaxID=3364309 RepID=UPI0037B7F737